MTRQTSTDSRTEAVDDDRVCADGYPEHVEEVTYEGPDGVGWVCRRCGAEGWEPAEDEGTPQTADDMANAQRVTEGE